MRGIQARLELIVAKQSLPNSCASACIATACGFLRRDINAEELRDRLELLLGDNPVSLAHAAHVARGLVPRLTFESYERRELSEAIEAARGPGVVIVGVDASVLYGERGRERRHSMIIDKTTTYDSAILDARQRMLVDTLENQGVRDPDPAKFGRSFSLVEITKTFTDCGGQYLVVRDPTS